MKKYINENLPINQRVGQIGINNQGEKMTIIAYRGADDIDIQFEDGGTIYNNCYGNFRTGNIKHPIRYEESFAYHIEVELGKNLDDIWNWEKNNENGINPYEIYKCSGKKVWLYCQEKDYHNDNGGYEISCARFSSKGRCPYCYNRKVHSKDSFAQWGIDTFGEDFLERYWSSYNTLDPWEIAPQSLKKVWLYCQEKDYHNWDKKGNKIGYETNCHNFYNGERCGYCGSKKKVHYKDSLAYNYPNIVKMIAIPKNGITSDDCLELPCSSKDSFYISCLDCNTISNKKYTLNQITRYGYSCKKCSDGISIPNKIGNNLLTQLNIKFEPEYSPYYFRNTQHTDFLLIDYNTILEMDGCFGNHTREYDYWRDFLNMKYGGYRTIRIDLTDNSRYEKDTFNYIKEQILNSELSNIFDLSNVDWGLIWEQSQNSLCIKTWELWNDGIDDIKEISKELDLNEATIRKYLKIGNELNKCNYKTKLEKKEENIKKALELYNSGVYNVKEISKELDLDETTIRKYLKNIKKINNNKIKVICMTTKKLFLSMIEGAKFYNIKSNHIGSCCNGGRKYCGKLEDGTPLVWRYINISHNRILRGENIKLLRKEVCK